MDKPEGNTFPVISRNDNIKMGFKDWVGVEWIRVDQGGEKVAGSCENDNES